MKQIKKQIVLAKYKSKMTNEYVDTYTDYFYDTFNSEIGDEALTELEGRRVEVKIVAIVQKCDVEVKNYLICKISSNYLELREERNDLKKRLDKMFDNIKSDAFNNAYELVRSYAEHNDTSLAGYLKILLKEYNDANDKYLEIIKAIGE